MQSVVYSVMVEALALMRCVTWGTLANNMANGIAESPEGRLTCCILFSFCLGCITKGDTRIVQYPYAFDKNNSRFNNQQTWKPSLIAIGEIHGAKENPMILREIVDLVTSQKLVPVIGFELPQRLIDNPEDQAKAAILDGRYSGLHKKLILELKKRGFNIFGFDLNPDQWGQVKDNNLSWRDGLMAENVNLYLSRLKQNEKMIIICGDAHFQTFETMVRTTKPDGEKILEKFSPMGSKISVSSLLALHLRYLIGQIFNHEVKNVQPITLTKEYMFRDSDDLLEIDIPEAHPINS